MSSFIALLALARSRWPAYLAAVLCVAAGTGMFLVIPQKLGALVQAVSSARGAEVAAPSFYPALTIALLLVGQAVMMAAYGYIVALVAEKIGNELRAAFFHHLILKPIDVGAEQLGAIASQFSSDLAIIQGGLSDTLVSFLRHALFTAGALVAMFLVDTRMAVVCIGSVLIVALVVSAFIHHATKALLRVQAQRARTVALLVESASNAYVIQAYGRSAYFDERFRERLADTYREIVGSLRLMSLINPVSLTVFAFAILGIMGYGFGAVASGRLSVADLVAFITYAVILVASVSQLGMTLGQMRQASAMLEKHGPLLRTTTASPPMAGTGLTAPRRPTELPPLKIRFEAVSYSYPGASKAALREVSFEVPAGRVTAIVGESGAGKSTLAGLMNGLLAPASGCVTLEPAPQDRAAAIGIVPQNPFLFAGTVAENIGFGREHIDRQDMAWAASAAHIHTHITQLAEGYDEVLQEKGNNLSRGQQQRIALARALAGRPAALILDEATASLDAISERAIRLAMDDLRGRMTVVVIAHHGEILSGVDHLIVLDQGRVIYEGPPQGAGAVRSVVDFLPQLAQGELLKERSDAA
ncbi:MAG TPA: ABC transporter ATP-binding protein [Burkholderiaceae bacterium]|jgi:ATP-binding cassette subfamily B protein